MKCAIYVFVRVMLLHLANKDILFAQIVGKASSNKNSRKKILFLNACKKGALASWDNRSFFRSYHMIKMVLFWKTHIRNSWVCLMLKKIKIFSIVQEMIVFMQEKKWMEFLLELWNAFAEQVFVLNANKQIIIHALVNNIVSSMIWWIEMMPICFGLFKTQNYALIVIVL